MLVWTRSPRSGRNNHPHFFKNLVTIVRSLVTVITIARGSSGLQDQIAQCLDDVNCIVAGVREVSPYAINTNHLALTNSYNCTSGDCANLTGLGLELWDTVVALANEQNSSRDDLRYVVKPMGDETSLVQNLQSGRIDVALMMPKSDIEYSTSVSVSSYSSAGLQFVFLEPSLTDTFAELSDMLAPLLPYVAIFFAIVMFAANLLWYFERQHRRSSFSKEYIRGIGQASYYSATTLTSVGFGDKTAKTVSGRLFTVLMAATGILFTSCFTAEVTTSLQKLRSANNPTTYTTNLADTFRGRRIAMDNTLATEEFESMYHSFTVDRYPSIDAAFNALQHSQVSAICYDSAEISFLLGSRGIIVRDVENAEPLAAAEVVAPTKKTSSSWSPRGIFQFYSKANDMHYKRTIADLKPIFLGDPFNPIEYSLMACRNSTSITPHKEEEEFVEELYDLCSGTFVDAVSAMHRDRSIFKITQKWLRSHAALPPGGKGANHGNMSVSEQVTIALIVLALLCSLPPLLLHITIKGWFPSTLGKEDAYGAYLDPSFLPATVNESTVRRAMMTRRERREPHHRPPPPRQASGTTRNDGIRLASPVQNRRSNKGDSSTDSLLQTPSQWRDPRPEDRSVHSPPSPSWFQTGVEAREEEEEGGSLEAEEREGE